MLPNEASLSDLKERLAPALCVIKTFASGEELRRKNNHYSDMYLVVEGEVEILRGDDAAPITIGAGSPVGEIGFLRGCRATATAIARAETTVLVLDDAALWKIEKEDPMLAVFLLRTLANTAEERLSVNASLVAEDEPADARPVEVLLCRTPEMLEDAMRMRYRVYCEELGRSSPYADHDRKVIQDELDELGYTFIAVDEDVTIGTLRANLAAEGPLGSLEEIYGMNKSPNHPHATMICTKFIVDQKRRGGPAAKELIAAMASYALKAGASECFIDCIPSLIPLYKRIGFVVSGEKFLHYENGPSIPMAMDVAKHAERLSHGVGR